MKRGIRLIFILTVLCGTGAGLNAQNLEQRTENEFLAGASKVVITPDISRPVWLAGYRGDRRATSVHDDLWARVFALTCHDQTVLFISLDLVGYLFDQVAMVKKEIGEKYGIPPDHILIASTHDHSGPDTIGIWGPHGKSGRDPEYLLFVRKKILECAEDAIRSREKADLYFAQVHYGDVIEDARPPVVINDLLPSLRAVGRDGKTIVFLVNYACHAETLNESNHAITSDYPGVLRERLEDRFGGVALFFAGDLGGMQTPNILFYTFFNRRRVGNAIARRVIQSQVKQKTPISPSLSVAGKQIFFPVDNPRFVAAIQGGLFGDATDYIKTENGKFFLPADLSVVKIGPAVFMTCPGELFPEGGNVLRAETNAEYKFLIGLCNDEIGYLVPRDEWDNGGYEESMSLGPQTNQIYLAALSELIKN